MPHLQTSSGGSSLFKVARVLRILRLLRVLRALRVVAKITAKAIETQAPNEVEEVEEAETEFLLVDEAFDRAVELIEQKVYNDLLERALRLEQSSFYSFTEVEQQRMLAVFDMFSFGRGIHRANVIAALRRFGCKVTVSSARFLIQEFSADAVGSFRNEFSLQIFATMCARAQVIAKYEPPGAAATEESAVQKYKGLSVIECRSLVEVFDQVDAPLSRGKAAIKVENLFFGEMPLDGLIDKSQLFAAIKNGGYNPTLQEMNDYMRVFDPNGTGWISKADYLVIMGRCPTAEVPGSCASLSLYLCPDAAALCRVRSRRSNTLRSCSSLTCTTRTEEVSYHSTSSRHSCGGSTSTCAKARRR